MLSILSPSPQSPIPNPDPKFKTSLKTWHVACDTSPQTCPKSRFPIRIIVLDIFLSQGLTLLTAGVVSYKNKDKIFFTFPQDVWLWIFVSMLFVFVSLLICSKFYKKMYPGIKLISTELVLFPFRLKLFQFPILDILYLF